ncbi:MAG: apolipoprotein N-acyltransferase [Spirochaetaceae bacterium]|nr:apolipoprotein N-acyltransferase [Spirochaetaceae bacterium]
MNRIIQVFYVIFSAIIFSLAIQNEFLPLGSPFLGLFALTPLYLALRNSSSYLESALLTGLQTLLVHLMSSFWLGFFRDFAIFTLGASALGTGVIGFVFGCYFHYFVGRKPYSFLCGEKKFFHSALFFASIWTLYEWAKSTGFLAYPWGTLVMTSYKWNLLPQIVDITGTWGLSFLFSLFGALVGEGIYLLSSSITQNNRIVFFQYRQLTACCLLLFAVSVGYGAWQLNKELVPVKHMETVMVQQNIDSWVVGRDDQPIQISQELTDAAVEDCVEATGAKPDVVVWSESVLSYTFPESEFYYHDNPAPHPLIPYIREIDVPFVIGGAATVDRAKEMYANAALFFDNTGEYQGYYGKMQLVPFAEVIPGAQYEWVRKLLNAVIGFSSGWTPGTEITLFNVPLKAGGDVTISIPICFEDAFPMVCRALFRAGSEVFVNITNDSWSMTNSAEFQHFAIASFRAIEFRTTLIRSTNSGYSVVVNPKGQVIADMPLFEEAALYTSVPIYQRQVTVYCMFGNWLPALCFILVLTHLIVMEKKGRRQ